MSSLYELLNVWGYITGVNLNFDYMNGNVEVSSENNIEYISKWKLAIEKPTKAELSDITASQINAYKSYAEQENLVSEYNKLPEVLKMLLKFQFRAINDKIVLDDKLIRDLYKLEKQPKN